MGASVRSAGATLVVLMLAGSAVAQDSGAEIYKAKCEHCHGVDGLSHTFAGKMSGAAQLTSPMAVQMQDADLVAVVTNGKKHMPAFGKKLTADQIEAVVGYVRTLQKAAPADAAPAAK